LIQSRLRETSNSVAAAALATAGSGASAVEPVLSLRFQADDVLHALVEDPVLRIFVN
jgi:hypothetical protein